MLMAILSPIFTIASIAQSTDGDAPQFLKFFRAASCASHEACDMYGHGVLHPPV
jgi:hypothetical protein